MTAANVRKSFDTGGLLVDRKTYSTDVEDGHWETDDYSGKEYWVDDSYTVYDEYLVRAYPKCASFDHKRGRVGVLFHSHYSYSADGSMSGSSVKRLDWKVRNHPRDLITFYR